jgi:hypothetical protein
MIDGIGHWLFEDRQFEKITNERRIVGYGSYTIREAEKKAYEY